MLRSETFAWFYASEKSLQRSGICPQPRVYIAPLKSDLKNDDFPSNTNIHPTPISSHSTSTLQKQTFHSGWNVKVSSPSIYLHISITRTSLTVIGSNNRTHSVSTFSFFFFAYKKFHNEKWQIAEKWNETRKNVFTKQFSFAFSFFLRFDASKKEKNFHSVIFAVCLFEELLLAFVMMCTEVSLETRFVLW